MLHVRLLGQLPLHVINAKRCKVQVYMSSEEPCVRRSRGEQRAVLQDIGEVSRVSGFERRGELWHARSGSEPQDATATRG